MSNNQSIWHRDAKGARKRTVRIETIGKTFLFFENQWRSEAYYFGDLVYRGMSAGSHIFGLEDGIKERPHWELGFHGDPPTELMAALPKMKQPMLSGIGMLIIAFLCLGIVYFGSPHV
ncbi:MAG: hypothetical protein ABJO01_02475 [Parasphingorhabdus sp.]|uniref:hypothetical protein n=1 Tax=Parasphingorhabdus sp. TaxID=2709688 RepID=UPI00329716CF